MRATLEVAGRTHDLELERAPGGAWMVTVDGEAFQARLEPNGDGVLVRVGERTLHLRLAPGHAVVERRPVPFRILGVELAAAAAGKAGGHVTHVRPPMNGKLERLLVKTGEAVAKGDVLFVLEAMKMQNEVRAPVAGRVAAIHLAAGATVEPRQVVLDLEPA
jgi:biotin carboxyl carrier protein